MCISDWEDWNRILNITYSIIYVNFYIVIMFEQSIWEWTWNELMYQFLSQDIQSIESIKLTYWHDLIIDSIQYYFLRFIDFFFCLYISLCV